MARDRDTLDKRYETPSSKGVDTKKLETELRSKIEGEVRFDDGSRALYEK
jgi:hypothetical protein